MNIYKLWDITDEKKVLLLETIDKREVDGLLSEMRQKMLDTEKLIMLESKTLSKTEEYFD
ncbi:MAG: hypothetical protein IKO53_08855 [Lachnospiraceae bacterium]|nr:hypothetical protein [Lachnospiraceae bacterium]